MASIIGQTGRMTAHEFVTVQTTTDSAPEVANLASALVEQRLAACVQVSQIQSYYRWEGKVHHEPEFLLTLKTSSTAIHGIKMLLDQQHSYDEPELIVTPITDGSDGYLEWVREQTAPEAAPEA